MVDPKITHISATEAARLNMLQAQKANFQLRVLQQVEAKEDFQEWAEKGEFSGLRKDFKTLEEQHKHRGRVKGVEKKSDMEEEGTQQVEETNPVDDTASQYERGNPELKMKTLVILRNRLSPDDTAEDILRKVLEVYSDYSLADEALDFLIDTTGGDLQENVQKAKDDFNRRFDREIRAGRNIAQEARRFAEEGLGSPTGLRDIYRDITGNPREPLALFNELFTDYTYAKMKTVIDFIYHSLGADLKAKGPSISRAELQKLVEDARTLNALLGIYRFFKERMGLIESMFRSYDQFLPSKVTFELLAKLFIQILGERYLSPDKVLQLARLLGVKENVIAQIILFTQMRDAVRGTAPRLYRNEKHKQDTLKSILEALEELEEEEDEDEEEE